MKRIKEFFGNLETCLIIIFVLLIIASIIMYLLQFLWSITPIVGSFGLIITLYFTYLAYKNKNSKKFTKYKNIAITLLLLSLLAFTIPKGPTLKEREEQKMIEDSRKQEERYYK